MTEYGSRRIQAASFMVFLGVALAALIYFSVLKFCKNRNRVIGVIIVLLLILLVPTLSMFAPGRITYARFGITVYGVIPILALDITVNSQGLLWFRDKSHWVSLDEVQSLLTPDVDILVIGIGWDEQVNVDPEIKSLDSLDVYILPTPQALDKFNQFKSEGKKTVLVSHSTC